MKHVCVIGGGVGGIVLALELIINQSCRVTLIDIDKISEKFKRENVLETELEKNSLLKKFQTVGYGFGGTSNLWHGVITRLDDEDYDSINNKCQAQISNELRQCEIGLAKYFVGTEKLDYPVSIKEHALCKYIDIEKFIPKTYVVNFNPTRFRKILNQKLKYSSLDRLNLLQSTIALRFQHEKSKVISLECIKEGQYISVKADQYVVCTGALETPRLLMQSFEGSNLFNKLLGRGLMDHPSVALGEVILPKKILYNHHGKSNVVFPNSSRIGFRIPAHLRKTVELNHSIFFRPHLEADVIEMRRNMRTLIYGSNNTRSTINFLNYSMFKAAMSLALEKSGIGYLTKQFLVTAQFEQASQYGGDVILTNRIDGYGRRVPRINNKIDELLLLEAKHISSLIGINFLNGTIYTPSNITLDDFDPGSHHSGTCRLGAFAHQSVVNLNLQYHGIENLYVCDASILPKIGNANITFTIANFAVRLAKYLNSIGNQT